jgi:hypothetical protein
MTWLGFAVFGLASLLIWLSTSQTIDSSMDGPPVPVMTWGLRSLMPYFNQAPFGSTTWMNYLQVCHSLEVILAGFLGAILGRHVPVQDDRPNSFRA